MAGPIARPEAASNVFAHQHRLAGSKRGVVVRTIMQALLSSQLLTMATAPKPLRIFLFSHPRTASNLLCKLFSAHPDVGQRFYPFGYAHFIGPDAQALEPRERKDHQGRKEVWEMMKHATYQFQLDQMEKEIAEWEAVVRHRI
jgi:hypothetical protein